MPCQTIQLPGGGYAIVRTSGRRSRPTVCQFCKVRFITKLCDKKVGASLFHTRTCDAGMCDECATNVAPEVDYCPDHKAQEVPR